VAQQKILNQINVFGQFKINWKEATVDPRQPFNPRMEAVTAWSVYMLVSASVGLLTVMGSEPNAQRQDLPASASLFLFLSLFMFDILVYEPPR
jgi:hypothetical protein